MQKIRRALMVSSAIATLAVEFGGASSVCAAPRLNSVDAAELRVPIGHSSVVTALELSADEKWLLSGAWDDSVRLWEASSGREIYRFHFPRSGINSVASSPDGKRMYAAGSDGLLRVWSLETGALLSTSPGHQSFIQSIAVSPSGELVATGSGYDPPDMQRDNTVRVWDAETGKQLRELTGHSQAVMEVRFLSGGREIISASLDGSIRIWRTADGKLLRRMEHGSPIRSISISANESLVVSGGGRFEAGTSPVNDAKLWDLRTGKVLRMFGGHSRDLSAVAIAADGGQILTASFDGGVRLWRSDDSSRFLELVTASRRGMANRSAVFTMDGKSIFVGDDGGVVRRWNVRTQRVDTEFGGAVATPVAAAVAPDGSRLVSANSDGTVRVFTVATGESATWRISRAAPVSSVSFSRDSGKLLVSAGRVAELWDVRIGRRLRTYGGNAVDGAGASASSGSQNAGLLVSETDAGDVLGFNSASLSASGDRIAIAGADGTARVYDAERGQLVATLVHPGARVTAAAFLADERFALTAASDNKVRLWDVRGQQVLWAAGGASAVPNGLGGAFLPAVNALALSANGGEVFAASNDGSVSVLKVQDGSTLRLFRVGVQSSSIALSGSGTEVLIGGMLGEVCVVNAATGAVTRRFRGHTDSVSSANYLLGGLVVSTSRDGTMRIWRESAGHEIAAIVSFKVRESVVVDPEGRFDAPRGGESSPLFWVVGRETIELDQLKERFFVPGLLARKLRSESLPSVESFERVALHPRVEVVGDPAVDSNVVIRLSDRGGGIGPVRLKLNGKEIVEDARPPGLDPEAAQVEIQFSLDQYRSRLRSRDENALEVQAFNREGYLRSRGGTHFASTSTRDDAAAPKLWAVIVGVSSYSQPTREIDLKYAAKDAADIAFALKLGGEPLFGAENVDIVLLASGQEAGRLPTKRNLQAAFERLGSARANDVVVVYFSGHGVSYDGEYYFPTQEADSLDITDPRIRAGRAISGREIAAWLKTDAEKQVVVLDTCAAGAFERSLAVERSVPTDQVRAIERMKDRAGLYVLMGSAANRVSYEATPYRQGLLTHAILKAMSGAMLRDDKFVNVAPLMDYAVDEVVKLARSVGGVQKPYVATPKEQTRSFDIGLLDRASRHSVPLRSPKMMLLRPVLLGNSGADDLFLTDALSGAIREMEFRNGDAAFVFVDADQMSGAVKPTGLYAVDENGIEVRLVLTVKDVRKQRTVRCDRGEILANCAASLVAAIDAEIGAL